MHHARQIGRSRLGGTTVQGRAESSPAVTSCFPRRVHILSKPNLPRLPGRAFSRLAETPDHWASGPQRCYPVSHAMPKEAHGCSCDTASRTSSASDAIPPTNTELTLNTSRRTIWVTMGCQPLKWATDCMPHEALLRAWELEGGCHGWRKPSGDPVRSGMAQAFPVIRQGIGPSGMAQAIRCHPRSEASARDEPLPGAPCLRFALTMGFQPRPGATVGLSNRALELRQYRPERPEF
jgi:hypothetical protein